MIINWNIIPQQNIYFVWYNIIKILINSWIKKEDFLKVFELYNKWKDENNSISLNTFMLSLDWLYLLNLINIKNNKIVYDIK